MIGIDLLEIDRLERALVRHPRLAERLFTPAERDYAAARGRPAQHLAARFCAKEAVFKALRLEVLRPLEIEVAAGGGGGSAPHVVLHGAARDRARELGVSIEVSLTHSREMAAAVAVLR
jgi:holo-[acyl-carrier protein] synthase